MTTTTTKSRISAVDPQTGRKYVKTQTVEGATVTVTQFVGEEVGGSYRWTSALYDVTSPAGQLFAGAIKWDGKTWKVGAKTAPTLTKAVRAVLGTEQLPEPRAAKPKGTAAKPSTTEEAAKPSTRGRPRKSAATRKAEKAAADLAAQSGSAVIDKDPDTGLPRIKPEVAAKADAIVAAQLARNAEAGK